MSRRSRLAGAAVALALAAAAILPTLPVAQEAAPAVAPAAVVGTAAEATFAAGCFWCSESDFEQVPGVLDVVSGYTGGSAPSPTYRQVSAGGTGHTEAVRVRYDPAKVTYDQLLEVYWRNVDFLDAGGQFCDRGDQYRSGIFAHDAAQRQAASASKAALERSGRLTGPVVTEVVDAGPFYPAEDYHQDYYKKNPVRYKVYRYNCGRDARLEQLRAGTS